MELSSSAQTLKIRTRSLTACHISCLKEMHFLNPAGSQVDVKALMQNKATYYHAAHTEKEVVQAQPDMLVGGTLRLYQMQGLQWLVSLYNNRLSGVLADEMGLGKTIQIVALIAYLMEVKNVNGPFLIVAPLSVIDNWVREFESWTPRLKKIIYYGDKEGRKRLQKEALKGQFNVMLTSYELVLKDANFMAKISWVYIIVDEGHRMKNAQSKLTTTLSLKFPSKFRILITGTPLQNNLNELWSLLNFLLPDIFRHDSNFEEWFNSVQHLCNRPALDHLLMLSVSETRLQLCEVSLTFHARALLLRRVRFSVRPVTRRKWTKRRSSLSSTVCIKFFGPSSYGGSKAMLRRSSNPR